VGPNDGQDVYQETLLGMWKGLASIST